MRPGILAAIVALGLLGGCHHPGHRTAHPDAGHRGGATQATTAARRSPADGPDEVSLVDLGLSGQVSGQAEETLTFGTHTVRILGLRSRSGLVGRSAGPGAVAWRAGDLTFTVHDGDCIPSTNRAARDTLRRLGTEGVGPQATQLVRFTREVPRSSLTRTGAAKVAGVPVTRYAFDHRADGPLGRVRVRGQVSLDAHDHPVRSQGSVTLVGWPPLRWRFRATDLGKAIALRLPRRCRRAKALVARLDTVPEPPGAVDRSTIDDHPGLMYRRPARVIRRWYEHNLPRHGWTVRPAKGYPDALWVRHGHTRILLTFDRAPLGPGMTFTAVTFYFGKDVPPPLDRLLPPK